MLLWLAFLALPVTAADFDYRSPAFWMRSYGFPTSYCLHNYVVEVKGEPADTKLPTGCAFTEFSWSEARIARCAMPEERVLRARKTAEDLGRILAYEQNCGPPPEYPELYYKRGKLAAEWRALAISSATIPAIAGLLAAQTVQLDSMIELHEAAKTPHLELVFARIGTPTAKWREVLESQRYQDGYNLTRARARRGHDWHPWERKTYPACSQVPYGFAEFTLEDRGARAALDKKLSALGTPYSENECDLASRQNARMIVTPLPLKAFPAAFGSLDFLTGWNASPGQRYHTDVRDDEREKLLSRELRESAAALDGAPHIVSLVQAELHRVKGAATRLRQLRRGTLLMIRVKPDEP